MSSTNDPCHTLYESRFAGGVSAAAHISRQGFQLTLSHLTGLGGKCIDKASKFALNEDVRGILSRSLNQTALAASRGCCMIRSPGYPMR